MPILHNNINRHPIWGGSYYGVRVLVHTYSKEKIGEVKNRKIYLLILKK